MSPLYSYCCAKCERYLEALIPLKDADKIPKCPHCGRELTKLVSCCDFKVN